MRTTTCLAPLLSLLCSVHALIGCSGAGNSAQGSPPVAALKSSTMVAQVGTPVSLDASDSSDPDGFLVSYLFTFADGSPSTITAAPGVTHYFSRAGLFDVTVLVTDDAGLSATARVKITISEDPIQTGCLNHTDCLPSELCVDGHCELAPECSDDKKCPPGLECNPAGRCTCSNDGALCLEICVDLGTDVQNCGHCGRSCERGQTCQSGHCVGEELCPDGLAECSDKCVNLQTDRENCGFCALACERTQVCQNGRCLTDSPCERGLELCGEQCVDVHFDPSHCGKCFRTCRSGVCENGECIEELCPDGLTFCNGYCPDTSFDPFHCGRCNNVCDSGQCQFGTCVDVPPPGTVIDKFPSPVPFCAGLTFLDGNWFAINGRRIIQFDPFNGKQFESFFVKGAKGNGRRRAYGLASQSSMFLGPVLLTGAFDEENFFAGTDLEIYDVGSHQQVYTLERLGGGMTFDPDRNAFYVYDNGNSQLVTVNADFGFEEARVDVPGLGFGEIILDLALDGQGNVWAVRPLLENLEPLMVKITIDTGNVVQFAQPPGMDGVGGVVLVDGFLYGAGQGVFYKMQP